jgi:hypothetical protein
MRRVINIILFLYIILAAAGFIIVFAKQRNTVEAPVLAQSNKNENVVSHAITPSITQSPLPERHVIPQSFFISQTFNNCGPASLSMVMAMQGTHISQDELGAQMRPYQVAGGDNDDKSIFVDEFVSYAKQYGFESMHRPNGTIEILKKLTSNGIPVVVRTWLNPDEDIGHFRIVRGYDEKRGMIIQDDSYQGANLEYSYEEFLAMWQPFNYGYILVYPRDKHAIVEQILNEEMNENVAFENSIARAKKELAADKNAVYPHFNLSTASYHLGRYEDAVREYELAADGLPWRMLWYQIEPIQAYEKVGNREKVFSLSDAIVNNHNRAFSELYQIRGDVYLKEGDRESAKSEYEKALYYNKNFKPAQASLEKLR